VIATGVTGVTADGRREVLGFDVGDSEHGAFWTALLPSLKARGHAKPRAANAVTHLSIGSQPAEDALRLSRARLGTRPLP
jgi:hypothetical protein